MRLTMTSAWRWRAAMAALTALAPAACSAASDASTEGRQGNLGHGVFGYQCQSDSDPACPSGSTSLPACDGPARTTSPSQNCFPSAVALGGRFRVQYTPGDSTANVGNPTVTPVSNDYLSAAGDGLFQALKPGYAGVVARSTVTIEVVDYTLLRITPIAAIRIQDSTGKTAAPSLVLPKGGKASYKLVALGKASEQLAGAVDYTWSSSNLTVVRLGQGNPSATMTVEALAPGSSTLTATSDGKIQATLAITVTP
jgi:hypothetical protein